MTIKIRPREPGGSIPPNPVGWAGNGDSSGSLNPATGHMPELGGSSHIQKQALVDVSRKLEDPDPGENQATSERSGTCFTPSVLDRLGENLDLIGHPVFQPGQGAADLDGAFSGKAAHMVLVNNGYDPQHRGNQDITGLSGSESIPAGAAAWRQCPPSTPTVRPSPAPPPGSRKTLAGERPGWL